jgi:hypothetical protein
MKLAVTAFVALMVTEQVAVPAHAPDHPVKSEAGAAVAVRVTMAPVVKLAEHVLPQSIPAGEEATVPLPAPLLLTARLYRSMSKLAVTDLAASMVTVQVPVPLHAPDHPANVDVPSGLAVNVTSVPAARLAAHVLPQEIPAGDEVTVPLPVPAFATFKPSWTTSKFAATDLAEVMVTTQVPVPTQAPDQPVNTDPPSAVAARLMTAPVTRLAPHVVPQLIPDGEDPTVPAPAPVLLTANAYWTRSKLAVTDLAASMARVHAPVPLQAPDQPVKVELASGLAVNVTTVPVAKLAAHVLPQATPAGDEVTVPLPVPVFATFKPS